MSTGTEIVEDALRAAKVTSVAVPSEPEDLDTGFERLKSMIQLWLSYGVVLNTNPIAAVGEDFDEPLDARNAIVDNLAVSLAHYYSIPISPDLANNALVGLNQVKTLYQEFTIPDLVVSSTLPTGAGNSKGIDAKNFFNKGDTIGN